MQTFRLGLILVCSCRFLLAQHAIYAGVGIGTSTLSADAQAALGAGGLSTSQYKPENGLLVNAFAGVHLTNFFSVEADYVENRNDVRLISLQAPATSYDQARESRQNAFFGSGLLYFRRRSSWVRPFLAAGVGAVSIESRAVGVRSATGMPLLPPEEFQATHLAFRTTAGVDVRLRAGFRLRYSFSEALSSNPFSRQLQPPGERNLANFHSLFGLVWEAHPR